MKNKKRSLDILLKERPKFHRRRDAGSQNYSMGDDVLKWIAKYLPTDSQTLETGCGYSTVIFAAKSRQHTVISPFPQEVNLIREWCHSNKVPFDHVTHIASESQEVIHSLQDHFPLDMVLIDGDHAFPAPFIDWYYTADRIKEGGFVVVDDTQLITGKILHDFLYHETTRWGLFRQTEKTSIFKKLVPGKVAQGMFWTQQPYLTKSKNSQGITKKKQENVPVQFTDFNDFTYSKKAHFNIFSRNQYDIQLEKRPLIPSNVSLKNYQDLLVYAFIKEKIPKKSKLLEIGGGNSRIIRYFKNQYECWNIDKLEGLGNGPKKIETDRFRLVRDYIGNFSNELPDEYFDFVFSISTLEHIPNNGPAYFSKILNDLNRVLKKGGYSLHCVDSILKKDKIWKNPLLDYLFENQNTENHKVAFEEIILDEDIFFLSKKLYQKNWYPITKKPMSEVGKPFSINILWKKE